MPVNGLHGKEAAAFLMFNLQEYEDTRVGKATLHLFRMHGGILEDRINDFEQLPAALVAPVLVSSKLKHPHLGWRK